MPRCCAGRAAPAMRPRAGRPHPLRQLRAEQDGRAAPSHVSPEALCAGEEGCWGSGVSSRHTLPAPGHPLLLQAPAVLTHSEKAPAPTCVSSADFCPGLPGREELVPRERRLRPVRVPEAVAHVQHRHAGNDQPRPVHRYLLPRHTHAE